MNTKWDRKDKWATSLTPAQKYENQSRQTVILTNFTENFVESSAFENCTKSPLVGCNLVDCKLTKPVILSFKQVADAILNLTKFNFVSFIKKLLIFSNMKIAYQGKKEEPNIKSLVLRRIGAKR